MVSLISQLKNGKLKQAKLIIIDSLTTIIYPDEDYDFYKTILSELKRLFFILTEQCNLAVLLTNLQKHPSRDGITTPFQYENDARSLLPLPWGCIPDVRIQVE